MRGLVRRIYIAGWVLCLVPALGYAFPTMAQGRVVAFRIAAQSLSTALIQFSDQAHVQVITQASVVSDYTTLGVFGHMSPETALAHLLTGTDLSYARIGKATIAIRHLSEDPHRRGNSGGSTPPLAMMNSESSQTDPLSSKPTSKQSRATELSKMIVTGSHIPRTNVATSQPVITITRQQIETTGFTSVGQILQNLPQMGLSQNPLVNTQAENFGVDNLNLENLGPNRTLVLVNGHRWLPTLNGLVDVSSIPAAVVQRIEILLNGASAIYGSDAISGVVNIITTKNFRGTQINTYEGIYDARNDGGGWDGKTQDYNFTLGTGDSHGSIMLSVGYRERDPIWAGNRTITTDSGLTGVGKPASYAFILGPTAPGGFFQLTGPTNPNGVPCFAPLACTGPLFGPNANPAIYNPASNVNPQLFRYLTIPSERWHGYVQGHYDLTDNVTYNTTFLYQHNTVQQVTPPTPLRLGAAGNWFANGLPIGVSATNPYNPFGTDLIPTFSTSSPIYTAWCARYGSAPGGGCLSNSDLLLLSEILPFRLGYRTQTNYSNSWYFRNGLNGFFQLAGNQWDWDVSYGFSRISLDSVFSNSQNTVSIQQALGPLSLCNTTPGCVPLNIFGGQTGITTAMKQFVNAIANNRDGLTQRDYEAGLAGNFWNQWYAGSWGAAAGYEHLEQDGFFTSAPSVAKGNYTWNTITSMSGRINSNAQYAELNIPLASNLPGAKNLSLNLANRWTQFHLTDPSNSSYTHASTGRIAFIYQPIESLLVRGSWSQNFRVPSLLTLFGGQQQALQNPKDPCISPSGTPPYPNCPNPSPTGAYGLINVAEGSNPHLNPERGTSRQLGVVWSPRFVSGLDITADYYKTEVIGAVGSFGPETILDGCYVSGIQNFCNLVSRNSGGQITDILNIALNTGSLKTNGWNFSIRYLLPSFSFGQMTLRLAANFVKEFVSCNEVATASSGLTSRCIDYAGTGADTTPYSVPKKRINFSINWNRGLWGATWNMEMIGRMYEQCAQATVVLVTSAPYTWCSNYNSVNGGVNEEGTTVYHDVQVRYTYAPWKTTFTLGVNNLFDKQPPVSMTSDRNNFLPYYRVPGQFIYGQISVSF